MRKYVGTLALSFVLAVSNGSFALASERAFCEVSQGGSDIQRVDPYPGQPFPYPPSNPGHPNYPQPMPPSNNPTPPYPPTNPGNSTAEQLYQAGMRAYQSGDYYTAGMTLRQLVEKYPTDSRAAESAFISAESYSLINDFTNAIDMYRRVVNQYATFRRVDEAAYCVGFCMARLGDSYGAISEFKNFATKFPRSNFVDNAWYQSGATYEQLGDRQNAITCYRKVVYEFPGSDVQTEARERLAALQENAPPLPPNQPPSYPPNTPPLPPSYPPAQLSDQELYDRGHSELIQGNYQNAILYFDQLLKKFPASPLADDACLWKGKTYLEQGEYSVAMEIFAGFKRTYGASDLLAEACYSLGWCELNIAKQDSTKLIYFQKAAAEFSDFVARFGFHPWAPEALYLSGESNEYYGDLSKAQSCYRAVVNRFPGSSSAQKAQDKLNGTY
ncbi:MAG: tetratricopeptide repeat protein [Candidatus Ozemobacteraceae bacterium]